MILTRVGNNIKFISKRLTLTNIEHSFIAVHRYSQNDVTPVKQQETITVPEKKEVSKAMKAYLDRAKSHDEFMKQQITEYQIGKRHLANMMGENPDTFTQEDIDNAIEYLFPSGLFDKKARPFMKPPEEVYPQRKAAEFDETGRPYHFMFYCGKPNFFKLMYDIVDHMNSLNKFEDKMIANSNKPDPAMALIQSGYQWLDKLTLEATLVETISDKEYENFINVMERLIKLPYSYRIKDFIEQYRKTLMSQTTAHAIPKVKYDSDGRAFITTYECLRKTARGHVTLRAGGTGLITINDQDIRYFENVQCREQLLFPLTFTDLHNKIDVEAHVEGGGSSGQAGAIRWGIAWGLRSFVDEDMVEKMRLAGLLQRDFRTRERKKPGQAGARKKFTWKKR